MGGMGKTEKEFYKSSTTRAIRGLESNLNAVENRKGRNWVPHPFYEKAFEANSNIKLFGLLDSIL